MGCIFSIIEPLQIHNSSREATHDHPAPRSRLRALRLLCYHALALHEDTQQVLHNTVASESLPSLLAVMRREFAIFGETRPALSDVVIAGNDTTPTPYANMGRTATVTMISACIPVSGLLLAVTHSRNFVRSTCSSKSSGVCIIFSRKYCDNNRCTDTSSNG